MPEIFVLVPPPKGAQTTTITTAVTDKSPSQPKTNKERRPITVVPASQPMTSHVTIAGMIYISTASVQALA